MDSEKFYPLIRQNIIPLALGGIGVLLVLFGLFQIFANKQSQSSLVLEEEGQTSEKSEIVIDIEGAVIKPGVYKLPGDSRTVDALAAAGGLSQDADRNWVEKNINLAQKALDGLKIYIPREGEEILSQSSSIQSNVGSGGPVVNINNATSSNLEALPGVGNVTASKIIEGRPYSAVEELLEKKIVGQATYEKIKDKVSAN